MNHLPAPELQGEDADQYEVIDHKYTHRLAQRPGSHVILKYQRDVVRHKPIADEILNSCLESNVLALDETPGKTGRKSKGKMQKGYFWCFYGDQDEMAFIFASSRSGNVIESYLENFEGVLLSDGYR
ncbi:MAG: IS66 family transposase [Endozoicomonas sp.]|uniref:IS66 family transposase n=1 Tax=Endozoicomonas sp. TaxID=1892382 RepID=UPI003D9B78DE